MKSVLNFRPGIEKPPPNEDKNLIRVRESQRLNKDESMNSH